MRSVEEKSRYGHGSASEGTPYANQPGIESYKGGGKRATNQHRKGLGSIAKAPPSKWDEAQKWLAGLSRVGGDRGNGKKKPRNSNADDWKLITSAAQKGRNSCASTAEGLEVIGSDVPFQEEGETKKIDCGSESIWRIKKPVEDSLAAVRSVCVRDMGTEMTPGASLDPSRTATPIRPATPSMRSPISSRSSTPGRARQGIQPEESSLEGRSEGGWVSREGKDSSGHHENGRVEGEKKANSLESRAMAWDEAERARYTARYKREEMKIQAWESHQKRKAEMEMSRMEVKEERMKARAQEKLANKLAATRRIAEEKRANAEARLNEQAAKTSERADYIRRTGHLPSSFSFKLPSICW